MAAPAPTTCSKDERFKAITDFDKVTEFESYTPSKFIGFEADNRLEHDMALAVLLARESNTLKRQRFVQGMLPYGCYYFSNSLCFFRC